MNKGNCILIGAGDLTISEIPMQAGDLVIAVDGGYEYCKLLEITPDYILGDFDSISEKEAESVAAIAKETEDKVIILPVEKDDTDTLAAIKLGLAEGYQSFRIYGGMGGRIEHTIANIQCLLYLKEHNAVGYLMDGTGMILVAKEGLADSPPAIATLSVTTVRPETITKELEGSVQKAGRREKE